MNLRAIIFCLMYSFSLFGLEISCPDQWQEKQNLQQGVLKQCFSKDRVDGFVPNMNITQLKVSTLELTKHPSPKDICNYIPDAQKRLFPLYKVITSKELTIGKIRGSLIVASYARGKADMCAYQFIFVDNDDLYTVVYSCALASFKALKSEFETSLKTLRKE